MSDTYGSGLSFGDAAPGAPQGGNAPEAGPLQMPSTAPQQPQAEQPSFGSSLQNMLPGAHYNRPDPATSALDQSAGLLEQRVKRATDIATNPIAQIFAPERVQAARDFVPKAAEELSKIEKQRADIAAGRVQARTLGLDPGEVSDHATFEDRVIVAQDKALKGNMRAFQGLQAAAPERAAAIAPQVYETVAGHLTKAQLAFDSLASMQNEGQYRAKVNQLRKDGTLTDLESLGLKVPASFEAFGAVKAAEGRALREARIGINTIGQKLEERNTFQPMEKKEAETYNGRLTTVYGDQVTNGAWGRNGSTNTRGLIVNGAADPNNLGKTFTLATPEQRKSVKEEFDGAVPKTELDKYREFNRTYKLATEDAKGKKFPDGQINTNPNVQQGIAEGLAAMLRGGHGGANVGLLNIETSKRGFVQGFLDSIKTNYSGALNTLSEKDIKPYLTKLTQSQIRDVMEVLKGYNDSSVGERVTNIAKRAGALGLNGSAFGLSKDEATGAIGTAIEEGRREQIERMKPNHQAIGGGDGVLQLNAQRPGAGAAALPPGAQPTNQLPGAQPLMTPVQQAGQPPVAPAPPPLAPATVGGAASGGGVRQPLPPPGGGGQPISVAGQNVVMPAGVSPEYAAKTQRIESGNERDPWKAGTANSSASGAFQFINSTWRENKPAGAPDRAKDATPQQQAEAFAAFTAKNTAALTASKIPVNDTTLYVAHNLGAGAATELMQSDPSMPARSVVGEAAARNNPLFFRGNPTVATVLQRYADAVERGPDDGPTKPKPTLGGAASAAAGGLMSGLPGGSLLKAFWDVLTPGQRDTVKEAATEHAPAIGSTAGAVAGGMFGSVPGGVAGGAAGGAAGQALKDYLRGNPQSPREIAKQAAIGGALGVAPAGRPVAGAAARVAGVGGIEAGDKAVQGGDAADVVAAGAEGAAAGVAGEMFGRALGMAGHKVYNLFAPNAQKTIQGAAKTYAEAVKTLETEQPKLFAGNQAAAVANPKYEAAEVAKTKAEAVLKDAGLKPEEAAYAHKVSSEGVPKQEAQAGKPGAVEQERLAGAYQEMENAVGAKGVGAVKATPRQAPKLESDNTDTYGPLHGQHRMPIKDGDGKQVGAIDYSTWPGENAVRIRYPQIDGPQQGSGLGVSAYRKVTDWALNQGKEVWSDKAVTTQAGRMYTALENRGYQVERNPNVKAGVDSVISTDGKPVYKITDGPSSKSGNGPVLTDGPMAAVAGKKVSAKHSELAEHVEMALTAPAKNWQEKWMQLKEARSDLLQAERDALTSTAPGRTKTANDMRLLADTVRAQQEKAAKAVFGPEKGAEFMRVLKVVDARYRRLMDATNGMDLAKAAKMTGEAGRDAERKFVAFAAGDPQAVAAFRAMKGARGDAFEATVPWTVAGEGLPVVGRVIKVAKLGGMLREWAQERAAGSPVKFIDLVKAPNNKAEWKSVRDILGTAGARGAVQSDALSGAMQ